MEGSVQFQNGDRCIIFDMDGVLVNSEPLHFEFEENFFKSLGITVSREEHETFVGTTNRTMWGRLSRSHILPMTIPELLITGERKFLTFLENRKSMTLIPGVEELLNRLTKAGFVIALASSSPSSIINFILSECRIENYFKIIMSGDDVEKGKPDPEIFLKTAEKNKTRPENCIVIEDSENGITAANRAGMKSIGYRNPGSGNQNLSGADLIIESFSSLTLSDITILIS